MSRQQLIDWLNHVASDGTLSYERRFTAIDLLIKLRAL